MPRAALTAAAAAAGAAVEADGGGCLPRVRPLPLAATPPRHRSGGASSFYINCALFGLGGVASRSAKQLEVLREERGLRLAKMRDLEGHTTSQRIAETPYHTAVTPDMDTAAEFCLDERKCSAVCRNAVGATAYYDGQLTKGFADTQTNYWDKGPWQCLGIHGMGPPHSMMPDHMEDCFKDLYDETKGVWSHHKVIKMTVGKMGKGESQRLLLNSTPEEPEDFDATKTRCIQDKRCEVVCHHDATNRAMLYGHLDKARKILQRDGQSFWKEIVQPAKEAKEWLEIAFPIDMFRRLPKYSKWHDERGWECLYLPKKCRQEAWEATQAKFKRDATAQKKKLQDVQELKKALDRDPYSPDQPVGLPRIIDYWADIGFPMGKGMRESRDICLGVPSQLAQAKLKQRLPTKCNNRTYYREVSGRWLECCDEQKVQDEKQIAEDNLLEEHMPSPSAFKIQSGLTDEDLNMKGLGGPMGATQAVATTEAVGKNAEQAPTMAETGGTGGRQLVCRSLHEEPQANCEKCDGGDEVRCVAPGWNGFPASTYSLMLSEDTPIAPYDKFAKTLEKIRHTVTPKILKQRQETAKREIEAISRLPATRNFVAPELQCLNIGAPGELKTKDGRFLFAAAGMPDPAVLLAAACAASPLVPTTSSDGAAAKATWSLRRRAARGFL